LALFLLTYGIGTLVEHMTYPGKAAEIEQLRQDVKRVALDASEDVYGQAAQMNRIIVSYQAYNKKWWADLAVPDEWDSVRLIEIPEKR
jgi:hypothetical protein